MVKKKIKMIKLISGQINQPQIQCGNKYTSIPRSNNMIRTTKDVFNPSFCARGEFAFPIKEIEEIGQKYLEKLTTEMEVRDKIHVIDTYAVEVQAKISDSITASELINKKQSFVNKYINKTRKKFLKEDQSINNFMGDFSHEAFDSFVSIQKLRMLRAGKLEKSLPKQREIEDTSVKAVVDNINETSARYQYLLDNKFFREKTTRGAKTVFNKVMETFENKAKTKNITLNIDNKDVLKKYSLSTYSDSKNDGILSNLIANAIKYSPENSTISMKFFVNDSDDFLHFAITDQGIGVPKEDQAGIFNKKRASNTGEIPGSGYGLYRASNYVKEFTKSEIKVTSPLYPDEVANKGTMFECPLISNTKKSGFEKLKNRVINLLGI
jgi:hypothetical protein